MPSKLRIDTIKDSGGTKTLAEVSGGEWAWGANVPSGTIIGMDLVTAILAGSGIGTTSSSYTDTGIVLSYTTKDSSSNSRLIFEFNSGSVDIYDNDMYLTFCKMTSSTDITYNADKDLVNCAKPWHQGFSYSAHTRYMTCSFRAVSDLESLTYSAGDTLHLRCFMKAAYNNNQTYLVMDTSNYLFSVTETIK